MTSGSSKVSSPADTSGRQRIQVTVRGAIQGTGFRPFVCPYAHVLACMVEHGLSSSVLGLCWDEGGYGSDGTIWGGEFLRVDGNSFSRAAHFRSFPLPGGEAAAREPRRSALGVTYAVAGDALFDRSGDPALARFSRHELGVLRGTLAHQVNSPMTTSAGRLFDAVASIVGLRQRTTFEGQVAMDLEFAADETETERYPFKLKGVAPIIFDWEPTLAGLRDDRAAGESVEKMSARFHNTLVEVIVQIAGCVGLADVVLTGGCFQNMRLLSLATIRLRQAGFTPYWPHRVPPNDGSIASGQVISGARFISDEMTNQNRSGRHELHQ